VSDEGIRPRKGQSLYDLAFEEVATSSSSNDPIFESDKRLDGLEHSLCIGFKLLEKESL
jgi:hypothetical protein